MKNTKMKNGLITGKEIHYNDTLIDFRVVDFEGGRYGVFCTSMGDIGKVDLIDATDDEIVCEYEYMFDLLWKDDENRNDYVNDFKNFLNQ